MQLFALGAVHWMMTVRVRATVIHRGARQRVRRALLRLSPLPGASSPSATDTCAVTGGDGPGGVLYLQPVPLLPTEAQVSPAFSCLRRSQASPAERGPLPAQDRPANPWPPFWAQPRCRSSPTSTARLVRIDIGADQRVPGSGRRRHPPRLLVRSLPRRRSSSWRRRCSTSRRPRGACR